MKEKKGYKIDKKVIIDFIKRSTEKVEGVFSVKRGLWGEGIKFKEVDEGMEISLRLVVKQGNPIPQIVEEVQKRLKAEIEKTFGTSVARVDVQIKGIKSSK